MIEGDLRMQSENITASIIKSNLELYREIQNYAFEWYLL